MQMQSQKCSQLQKQQSKAISITTIKNKKIFTFDKRTSFQIDQMYIVNQVIGRGVYGVVAEGENIITGQKVAVKLIKQLFNDPAQAKRELRQIKILKFLRHKNIVTLLDIMNIEDKNNYNQIYLVLEFMHYNLKKLIMSKSKITQNMTKFIIYQILDGLYYMHSADIIHRDLKPQNILINQKLQLKIADMNLARKQGENLTKDVVTPPYRALQVLLCSRNYTKSIDIWSVGCIFAELIGKTVLFEGANYINQFKRFVAILGKPKLQLYDDVDQAVKDIFIQILKQMPDRAKIDWKTLFPNSNSDALDLLDHMLDYDYKARYTAQQCLNHPFLKQIRQNSNLLKCQKVFDFSFDDIPMKIQAIKQAIYLQAQSFHPDQLLSIKRSRIQNIVNNQDNNGENKQKNQTDNSAELGNQQGQPRKIRKGQ